MASAPASPDDGERRRLVLAGLAFFGVLVVLIGLVAVFGGSEGDERETATTEACAPDDAACRAAQESGERPGIIPRPGEGHAPDDPGEPGGWEQIALFFALIAALSVIVALVVRSTRRSAGRRTPDPDATEASPLSR